MSREDQYALTVVVAGTNLGTFDKMTGGEIDSEETKYRPGNMGSQLSLGGYRVVGNPTVSRLFQHGRDNVQLALLVSQVGRGNMTIVKQPLDVDGHVVGRGLVYTGKLKSVNPPDADSESADAALIELEMTAATVAA